MREFVRNNKPLIAVIAIVVLIFSTVFFSGRAEASSNEGNDTYIYSFTKLDPSKPASWENSGVQTLTPYKTVGHAKQELCGVSLQHDVVKNGTYAPATITPPTAVFGENLVTSSYHDTKPCEEPEPPVKPEQPEPILINGPVVTETIDCATLTLTSVTSNEYNVWEFVEEQNAWVDSGKTVVVTDEPVVTTVTSDVAVNSYNCLFETPETPVTPPSDTTPVPREPITKGNPEALELLSPEQREFVENYAKLHNINPEDVLVENG